MKNILAMIAVWANYIASIGRKQSLPVIITDEGRKTFYTGTLYKAGYLNETTTKGGEMLLANTKQDVGVSSFEGNKLPIGIDFLVTGIRVLFDTTVGLQAGAGITASTFASVAPPCFKNGDFTLSQGAVLFQSSGTDVTNFKASTGNDDDFREISPVKLRGGIPFSLNVLLSNGVPVAADMGYKVELRGQFLSDLDQSTGNR